MTAEGQRLHEAEKQWMRDNWERIRRFHRRSITRSIIRFFGRSKTYEIADAIPSLHKGRYR